MYTYIGPTTLKPLTPLLPPPRKLTTQSLGSIRSPSICGCPPEFPNNYFLEIISALKGKDHSYLSRSAVAEYILGMTDSELKAQLIDFLGEKYGAIGSTLENNACKYFKCSLEELKFAGSNDPSDCAVQLVDLFQKITQKIVPNVIGMLYPLQHFDPDFNIRSSILTHFRDRVLVIILGEVNIDKMSPASVALLQPILSLVNQETQDTLAECRQFKRVFKRFIGKYLTDLSGPRMNWASEERRDDAGHASVDSPSADEQHYNFMAEKRRSAFRSVPKSFFNSMEQSDESINFQNSGESFANSQHELFGGEKASPNVFKSGQRKFSHNLQQKQSEALEGERKTRSTTMPSSNKNVTWDDQTTVHV